MQSLHAKIGTIEKLFCKNRKKERGGGLKIFKNVLGTLLCFEKLNRTEKVAAVVKY